jgi:hypothetical protein
MTQLFKRISLFCRYFVNKSSIFELLVTDPWTDPRYKGETSYLGLDADTGVMHGGGGGGVLIVLFGSK